MSAQLGPFYRDVIALDPDQPWDARSAAHRLGLLAGTLPFPVAGAQLVPSNNNDVWRLPAGYLRVAWRGDRARLAREARLLHRLRAVLPVPEVLAHGGDDRLSWSLTAELPGTPLDQTCTRSVMRHAAALLRELHSCPVPADRTELPGHPAPGADPLRRAGAELVPTPAAARALLPLTAQLSHTDPGVLTAAGQRLTEFGDPPPTAPDVLLHGDFYLGNALVRNNRISGLLDFEFARTGPRELELVSVVRALDVEARLGVTRPPLLDWLAADYPDLFAAPDLDSRLWAWLLAYAIRHILFWPPDRAEADGLDPGHPLHTLRRLVDAPPDLLGAFR